MIGNVNALGKGFKGLASYLESGKDGQQTDRVDWVEARNLPTTDPQAAARIMSATARESVRTDLPVYHFSVSFDPGDPVDRDAMRRVADRTLRDLGLEEHQVLIVAHDDTAHPHLHFVVNRVHPERGTAWSNWKDYPRIEKSLRAQEVELGLRVVPGKHARVPEREGPAPRRERGDAEFLSSVQERAAPAFQRARSWAELERTLAEHGLAVEVKGRGMVVSDSRQEVKASDVDRAFSRKHLEDRFGPWHEYRARVAVAQQEPEQTTRRARADAPAREAPASRPGAGDSVPNHRPHGPAQSSPERAYWRAFRDFSDELKPLYTNPAAARRAFARLAEQEGPERAVATLRERPHRLGELQPAPPPELRARAARAAAAGEPFAHAQALNPREVLKSVPPKAREHAHAVELENAIGAAAQEAGRLRGRFDLAGERRAYAWDTFNAARAEIAATYVNPRDAERRIWRSVRREDIGAAAADLRERPERFGELRGEERRAFGFWRTIDTSAARENAPHVAQAVDTAARAIQAAPRRGEIDALKGRVEKAAARLSDLIASRGASPAGLEAQIAGLLQKAAHQAQQLAERALGPMAQAPQKLIDQIVPKQIQQVISMMRAPHQAAAKLALDVAKRMVIGEHDRGR